MLHAVAHIMELTEIDSDLVCDNQGLLEVVTIKIRYAIYYY